MDADLQHEMQEYYASWWESPRDLRKLVFDRLNRLVAGRIPEGGGRQALDIGSGKGSILRLLLDRGFRVTGVEMNADFCAALRARHPQAELVEASVQEYVPMDSFALCTMIQISQNLSREDLRASLARLHLRVDKILMTVSNAASFHGWWVRFRGFSKPFVYPLKAAEFDQLATALGFDIRYRRGVGLLTPVSFWPDFRGTVVPAWLARAANLFEGLFPRRCHLYYVELVPRRGGSPAHDRTA